jgi:hypothetical protein
MTADEIELARLTAMLRARTNGDDPKPGYKQNVALLRRRIAERQDLIDAAKSHALWQAQLDAASAEAQATTPAS